MRHLLRHNVMVDDAYYEMNQRIDMTLESGSTQRQDENPIV